MPVARSSVANVIASGTSYSTNFPLTEGTISEGGIWLAPPTGWTSVTTTPGDAFGTQTAHTPPPFDDSVAIINPARYSFGANQSVQCVMHAAGTIPGTRAQEVEIELRATQGSNTLSLYEVDIKITGAINLVRWNGALNDFTFIDQNVNTNVTIADGAVWYADIVGPVVTVKCNGATVLTRDVQAWAVANGGSYFATGQPGIGMWGTNGDVAADFGWSSATLKSL